MGKFYVPKSRARDNRYLVSVKEYTNYHKEGYLIVRGLLSKDDIAELFELAEDSRLNRLQPDKTADAGDGSSQGGIREGDTDSYAVPAECGG